MRICSVICDLRSTRSNTARRGVSANMANRMTPEEMDTKYMDWIRKNSGTFKTPYLEALLRFLEELDEPLINEDVAALVRSKLGPAAQCAELYANLRRFSFKRIDDVIACMRKWNNNEVAKLFSDFKNLVLPSHPDVVLDFYENTDPIIVKVIPAHSLGGTPGKPCYKMTSSPRGLALLINNREFPAHPEEIREGSEHDFQIMRDLLMQLDYKVIALENVKSDELPNILKDFKNSAEFRNQTVDSCFVCIMTHGNERALIMSDSKPINNWSELIWEFDGKRFGHFEKKPKIIVVAACAGFSGVGVVREKPTPAELPDLSNMLVCTAALPGTPTMRHKSKGSWYINCLAQVVMNEAHCTEARILLGDRVQMEMQNVKTKKEAGLQIPGCTPYLFDQEFYFNPGVKLT